MILTSSIGSILIVGLIAPSNKSNPSCGIAMLWVFIALMATGFALYANSDYELLDGGVSITSIFLRLNIGVIISARLFQKMKRPD
ncbi:MAG: hypothetical protein EOO85_31715 [Pedobacter sp.]|nr:MAG: hypothetical protein EOO85_31715 [Pedobacter sp.]